MWIEPNCYRRNENNVAQTAIPTAAVEVLSRSRIESLASLARIHLESILPKSVTGREMASISDADEAALQRSLVALEPMIQDDAKEVLREAKEIFNKMDIVFFLRQGTCLGAIRGQGGC